MTNPKCTACGLVNFYGTAECRRCGAFLSGASGPFEGGADGDEAGAARPRRSLKRRVLAGVGLALLVLVGCYASLLETSVAANIDQRMEIQRAVRLIEEGGFGREAFLLRRLASYRTTDNWWNNYVGHADAYAATNFPFEVITLYPQFFEQPIDDTERAVILLHEARHLAGAGERQATASVWRDKERLGWTREKYGYTRVWHSVYDYTRRHAPELFTCGEDGRQDCAEKQ